MQKIQQCFQLTGLVPAIVFPQNPAGFIIQDNRFDGCGTYVNPGTVSVKSHNNLLMI
jgi:hypothetical protein